MQNAKVDPRFELDAMTTAAQSGSVAAEYIGSLAKAIRLAVEAVEKELKDREQIPLPVQLSPVSGFDDWRLIHSLLHLLEDQTGVACELFAKLEVTPYQVRRAVGLG